MFVSPPTGNGAYCKLSTPGPRGVRNKEVKLRYKFVPEGRDFVSVVRIREVSVWRGSTVVFFLVQNEYHVTMTSQWFLL